MKAFRKNRKGFTMIELMVVVIIVGVLAAIAIPLYGKYVKNARITEATGRIGEIITACKAWAQENEDNTGDPTWPDASDFGTSYLDDTDTENFTYEIAGGGNATSTALTVTATGRGRMSGVTVVVEVPQINLNGTTPEITGL